jgi:cell division protein FtsB
MLKKISLVLLFSFIFSSDISITAEAIQKAIVTQVKYETKEQNLVDRIEELKKENNNLKLDILIKETFIVVIAVYALMNK